MRELPAGWTWVSISAITEKVTNIKPEDYPDKEFGYVDISSICNSTYRITEVKRFKGADAPSRARRPIRPKDILFSNVRTYLRNIATVPPKTEAEICSTGFTVLRPMAGVDPQFLFRYVLTNDFIDRVTPQQTGTHYPATSDRVVMSELIPLPALNEQRRIVAKLEELLSKVDACQKRLAKIPVILKRFRQAVLIAACSGRLTADWRDSQSSLSSADALLGRNKPSLEPLAPDAVGLEDLPEGWVVARFGTVVDSIRGGSTAVPTSQPTHFPILRSSSVRPGFVDLEDVKYLGVEESENELNYLMDGDLLFTRLSGSLDYVANCAKVRSLGGRRIQYPDRLFCAKVDAMDTSFCELMFSAPFVRKLITERAKSSAGHQRVSISDITRQPIPMAPLEEQLEIVRRVERLFKLADQIERRYRQAQGQVDKLTQSILSKAFRGELVPTEAELARREHSDSKPA